MKVTFLIIIMISIYSCTKYNSETVTPNKISRDAGHTVITQEQALETLLHFMTKNEIKTRSGVNRSIKSIDSYPIVTKAGINPDAYIVNFEDNQGFAILGAHSDMEEIIAVTEQGNINPVTLSIINRPVVGDTTIFHPWLPLPNEDNDEIVVDSLTYDNIYSEEDDDYYIGGDISDFISTSIHVGLQYREAPSIPVVDYDNNSDDDITISPDIPPIKLNLQTQWDQVSPYNSKCKLASDGNRRLAGCSSVAASMVMAYNKFPSSLFVDNVNIDWDIIRSTLYLTYDSQEPTITHIPLLLGYFFWNCKRLSGENFTMITATQIKKRFIDLGYSDVVLYKDSDFTSEMMEATSQMIRNNKPVYVSAMRRKDTIPYVSGHSWVIEGVDPSNQMVYCNWGWSGDCNGYFSKNCFRVGNFNYTFHFRLLSYNIPSNNVTKFVTLY